MSAHHTSRSLHGRGKQRGAALLILLAIIMIGIAAILINSLSSAGMKNARQQKTAAVLAQAKAALIGYAITYGDTHSNTVPGFLPCPDTNGSNGEGVSVLSCGTQDVSAIGRLPWATLDVSDLRDGDGECLWYAVSGTYKYNNADLMNWDTIGQFQVFAQDGTLLTNQVVAVIFAPGAAVTGQNRSGTAAPICGGNYTAGNYLDNDTVHGINNATVPAGSFGIGSFIQGTSGSNVNDQMVFITRDELWNAVQKRSDFQNTLKLLTQKVAQCLAYYGNSNSSCGWSCNNLSLPWPAPVSLGTNQLSDYYNNANYNDTANLYAGRVPYSVGTSRGPWPYHNSLTTLMNSASCSPISAGWTARDDAWWNNWKDHLYYGLAPAFQPSSSGGQSCPTCPNINGAGSYAAIVIFAGQRLSGQARTDKSVVADYLEGKNAIRLNSPTTGGGQYQVATTTSTFNDVMCYLTQSLNVTCP
ncbi:MAG TPA: hypothetical protein VMJ33_10680 [Gallionella sp.]|nr:hypothetical protein [Gallionella sp.]